MKCPYCLSENTNVIDTRESNDNTNRRRRICDDCSKRFTTYEKVELIELRVIKKDGRIENFDRNKIKRGVLKACEKRPVSSEQIDSLVDAIERKIRTMDTTDVKSTVIGEIVMDELKKLDEVAYIRFASVYRSFKDLHSFEKELKNLKVVKTDKVANTTDFSLLVTNPKGISQDWDRERIVKSLIVEAELQKDEAEEIADEVELKVFASGLKIITVGLLRELVDNELFVRGYNKKLKKQNMLGMSTYNLNQIIFNKSNDNSNIVNNNPEAVNLAIAENTLKQYALQEIFSEDVANSHTTGAIHLHNLGYPVRVYSFGKDECMLVKINNRVMVRSFEQLWNEFSEKPNISNGFEIKKLSNVYVYDKNKTWTRIKQVVRHKSKKCLISIESVNGNSVIVTRDHPFITLSEEVPKYKCPRCGALTSKTNGSNYKGSKTYICTKCGRQFRKRIISYNLSRTVQKPAGVMTDKNWLIESDSIDRDKVVKGIEFNPMNPDLAYLIGLYISEGFTSKNYVEISGKEHLRFVKEFCEAQGFNYEIKNINIRIWSTGLARYIQGLSVGIGSENKALPKDFLTLNKDLVDTVIAGVFDGDGTIRSNNRGGSECSIRLTSRLLLSQIKHWLDYRQVKNSLTYLGIPKPRIYKGVKIKSKKPMYRIAFYLTKDNKELLKLSRKLKNFKDFKLSENCFPHVERLYRNAKIRQLKDVKYTSDYVYDITTDSSTFVCNGIIVHNCSAHSLEYIKKFGLRLNNLSTVSRPAKYAATLTGHLNTFLASMQAYYAGALGISYINVMYAPLVVGMTDAEMKQQAQYLIFSCSQNAFSRGGQSVVPEETIWVKEKGMLRQVSIGNLVDEMLSKDVNTEVRPDGIAISRKNDLGLEAVSFDSKGNTGTTPISAFARIPFSGDIYSIETSKGSIKGVTGEHSVFSWDGKKITPKKAMELKVNDYIISPLKINIKPNPHLITEFDVADFYLNRNESKNEVRVYDTAGKFKQAIKTKYKTGFYKKYNLDSGIKAECVRTNWLRYEKIPLKHYAEEVSDLTNTQLIYMGDSQNIIPKMIPANGAFVSLLGYYIAEGHDNNARKTFVHISNTEELFIKNVTECLKELNYPYAITNTKVKGVTIRGILAKLISDLCEDENGIKRIPSFVFKLSDDKKEVFLKAFHAGDGLRTRKTFAVVNTSENVVNGICMLLSQLGRDYHIFKRGYKNHWKTIYEIRVSDLTERVIPHKFGRTFRNKLKNLLKDIEKNKENPKAKEKINALEQLLSCDIGFTRIRKIDKKKYTGFIYDISTPPSESFLGGTGAVFFHNTLFIDFNVHTGIPENLKDVPAIGSKGQYTGKTYGEYEKEAQRFLKAMMEVWREGDANGMVFPFPKMDIHVTKETFEDPGQTELLKYACRIASENGSPYFVFDRDAVILSACCRLRTKVTDSYVLKHPESLRFCGFQVVTINLPQAAYRAGKGNIDATIQEIKKTMGTAMKAHLQKKKFIQSIMDEPGTPLWQVGMISPDGKPYIDLNEATYIIGLIGLNECVRHLIGQQLHESEEAYKLGLRIVSEMHLQVKEFEKEYGLKIALEETPAEGASLRFAKIDMNSYPEAKNYVRGNQETGEVYYTNSIHFTPDADIDIIERIEKQGRFNTLIESGCITHVFVGEKRPSAESIFKLVKKTWDNTQSSQITVSPEFTFCTDCKRVSPGYSTGGK